MTGGSVWHLRGTVLPDGATRDVYVDGDRVSFTPVPGAETLVEDAFLLPGLVDAHCHPGTSGVGEPLDEQLLRVHGTQCRDGGLSVLRVPGAAGRLPAWFGGDPELPRIRSAGLAVAAQGRFFAGWGRQLPPAEIPAAAVAGATGADGWCKLIVDWMTDDGGYGLAIPAQTVAETTRRVHRAGGRVAVHAQHIDGAVAAVQAGVDSVEHGMHLPDRLLATMAAQGTALVPTMVTFAHLAPQMDHPDVPQELRRWFTEGWRRHPELVRAAHEAGVTVLAGTDLPPGHLTAEIRQLALAGLPTEAALGAGSWTARSWLGLPGLTDGAPADVLAFDTDPREDLDVLDHPARIVTRGRLVR